MMRGNSIIAFRQVFIITFCAVTIQKLFFTDKTGRRKIAPTWKIVSLKIPPTFTLTITLTQTKGEFAVGQPSAEQLYRGQFSGHGRNIEILISLKRHTFSIKH